jgi:hypothetical protein
VEVTATNLFCSAPFLVVFYIICSQSLSLSHTHFSIRFAVPFFVARCFCYLRSTFFFRRIHPFIPSSVPSVRCLLLLALRVAPFSVSLSVGVSVSCALSRFVCVSNLRLCVASSYKQRASVLNPRVEHPHLASNRGHASLGRILRNSAAGGRGAQHRPRQHALKVRQSPRTSSCVRME